MYNPINMEVEDETRLLEKETRDKNKKKRYETNYIAQKLTKKEGEAEEDRQEDMGLKRMSYKNREVQVKRGFDILSNGDLPNGLSILRDNKQNYLQKPPQPWTFIETGKPSSKRMAEAPTIGQIASQVDLTGT